MQLKDPQKKEQLEIKITRVVQSWLKEMLEDVGLGIQDLHTGNNDKARDVIKDFLAKDEKELILIEAQVRLDHLDKGLLRQNTDVITLKHLAEQALEELKNGETKAALVLLQKMQMIGAEIEKIELSEI